MNAVASLLTRLRRAPILRGVVFFCAALGVAMLYMLSKASANTQLFSDHYSRLLVLGLVLALGLMVLIAYQLWVLRRKLKARLFGSKLTLRLMVVFVLMALVPGVLLYTVSVQFLAKSIESWFDVRVESALEGGIKLTRSEIEKSLKELHQKAGGMANVFVERGLGREVSLLNRLREQYGVEEATLINSRGDIIAFSSGESTGLLPDLPGPKVLRDIRQQQSFRAIESIPGKGLYLRVVVPVNALSIAEDVRALQVLQPVPSELANDAEIIQAGYSDYQELTLSRLGLQRIFGLTLTLALLLTLLSAIAFAFVISERFSAPLSALAESTRAIAKGDFSKVNPVRSRDEFGVLTQSFNVMTRQLADVSETVARREQQLQNAKSYLESILSNLSAGVLAFDERLYLRTINFSAVSILGVDRDTVRGLRLEEWERTTAHLAPFATLVAREFHNTQAKLWETQMEYAANGVMRTLQVKGSRLPANVGAGYIVVFDDITHLIQAQRDAAWGEVARRLAHEIKNPLTPIQLSAERLQLKLIDKLPPHEAQMLVRSTDTIVNQVTALKRMVNDFSEYARSQHIQTVSLSLNDLIREVLVLYESVPTKITVELDPMLPLIAGDMALLRQVLHNLMQNSLDALTGIDDPQIRVSTETNESGAKLNIADNGSGFSEALLARVFEPYITSKQKGTGLGLAIVKKIVDEHHGRIQVANVAPRGASVSIILPAAMAA
jgi:nitrogen fixation/metabolism regulation signal transduction histidine kinase